MSAARVAGYFAAAIGRMQGTELECSTAGVVGWLLATNDAPPSTEDIRAACLARMGHRPASGTVARVLVMLRSAGVLTYRTAHVRRFHGDTVPEGAIVPIRQANHAAKCPAFRTRRYLLPVRALAVVGFALTIVSGGVAPAADSMVSDARATLGSRVRPARPDPVSPPEKVEMGTRVSLSVESAPRADATKDAGRSAYAILGAWRPPDESA